MRKMNENTIREEVDKKLHESINKISVPEADKQNTLWEKMRAMNSMREQNLGETPDGALEDVENVVSIENVRDSGKVVRKFKNSYFGFAGVALGAIACIMIIWNVYPGFGGGDLTETRNVAEKSGYIGSGNQSGALSVEKEDDWVFNKSDSIDSGSSQDLPFVQELAPSVPSLPNNIPSRFDDSISEDSMQDDGVFADNMPADFESQSGDYEEGFYSENSDILFQKNIESMNFASAMAPAPAGSFAESSEKNIFTKILDFIKNIFQVIFEWL